jgi:hypothetical protein
MANVLVATNTVRKGTIAQRLETALRNAGHEVQHASFDDLISVLETLARFDGYLHGVAVIEEEVGSDEVHPLAVSLAKAVRAIPDGLSLQGALKVKSLPVAGVVASTDAGNWEDVRWSFAADRQGVLSSPSTWVTRLEQFLSEWRRVLLEELDYVGFAITKDEVGHVNINPTLVRTRRESNILSDEATPGGLRRGQYLILANDLAGQVQTFDSFQFLLQSYKEIAAKDGIKPESVFQRFFESNPHYIQRERFEEVFSKPVLRVPGEQNHLSPDFVQKPKIMSSVGTKWEVLDLKLPDDGLWLTGTFMLRYRRSY